MRLALKQALLVTGSVVFTNVSEIWRQMDTEIGFVHCSSLEWVQARHWYQDLTSYNRTLNDESCNMLALQNVILRYVLHVRIVECRRCETSWSVQYEVDFVTLNTYSCKMFCIHAVRNGGHCRWGELGKYRQQDHWCDADIFRVGQTPSSYNTVISEPLVASVDQKINTRVTHNFYMSGSVGLAIRLRAGRPRNRGSIPCKSNRFSCL